MVLVTLIFRDIINGFSHSYIQKYNLPVDMVVRKYS